MSTGAGNEPRALKVIGRRVPTRGGLAEAAPFLELVVRLRKNRPFLPRGLYRFRTFEESQAWSVSMMTRLSRRGLPR